MSVNPLVENKMLNRLYRSVKVIAWSLIPPDRENSGEATLEENESWTPYILATDEKIQFYLADLGRGVDRHGEMKLCLAGCLAIAAPFLLFRMKRSGFSNCRALVTGEGLMLFASR